MRLTRTVSVLVLAGALALSAAPANAGTAPASTPDEVLAGARPTLLGFTLDRVPFHVTGDAAALTARYFGNGPTPDATSATRRPRFDDIPH